MFLFIYSIFLSILYNVAKTFVLDVYFISQKYAIYFVCSFIYLPILFMFYNEKIQELIYFFLIW